MWGIPVFLMMPPKPVGYVLFQGANGFTLANRAGGTTWDGTMQYSLDGSAWQTWNGTTITATGGKIYLRGTGNTYVSGGSVYQYYGFDISGTVSCTGNIESLLDYATVMNYEHPVMAEAAFYSLFRNCTGLTSAPMLPAKTLTKACYRQMFQGCTSLASAPKLPAKTAAENCYYYMFGGCTALTEPPALPATTLAKNCFYYMFADCDALTRIAKIQASAFPTGCFQGMYNSCDILELWSASGTGHTHEFRLPAEGSATSTAAYWNDSMFKYTAGDVSEPSKETVYYTNIEPI